MKKLVRSIREFNWRLWMVLAVTLFVPAIYKTVRVYFLGDLPQEWGVNIASQLSWVNLLYEIAEEAFILPLFFMLGKALEDKKVLENRTATGLLVCGSVFMIMALLIGVYARPLCLAMASDVSTINETVAYIRLESIASIIGILAKFITVVLVTINRDRYMYVLLAVQTFLSIVFDVLFLSKLPISLNMGVNGIALTNIIVSAVMVMLALSFLKKEGINVFGRGKMDFSWFREYGTIGLYSALESLVRNIAYMLMISRMVNVIAQQGTYWVANSFIWTWLLLPATALYDVIKKETAESVDNIRKKTLGYIGVSILFSLLWLISTPLWPPFVRYVLNSEAYDTVCHVVLLQTVFYIGYIFNCICDGTIYGRGRTDYMLMESVFTNGIYYVFMFAMWKTGKWVPTLDGIALMFGIGTAVDLIPTFGCYLYLLHKEHISIEI